MRHIWDMPIGFANGLVIPSVGMMVERRHGRSTQGLPDGPKGGWLILSKEHVQWAMINTVPVLLAPSVEYSAWDSIRGSGLKVNKNREGTACTLQMSGGILAFKYNPHALGEFDVLAHTPNRHDPGMIDESIAVLERLKLLITWRSGWDRLEPDE